MGTIAMLVTAFDVLESSLNPKLVMVDDEKELTEQRVRLKMQEDLAKADAISKCLQLVANGDDRIMKSAFKNMVAIVRGAVGETDEETRSDDIRDVQDTRENEL